MLLFKLFTIVATIFQVTRSTTVTTNPGIHENKIRFPWGVNFKYNGILNHNLGRVWVVTKIPLPKISDFEFPEINFEPDCDFDIGSETDHAWTDKYYPLKSWLTQACEDARPLIHLLKAKEKFYRNEVHRIMENELYSAIPDLESAGRQKRFVTLIPAIAGVVTLAVESIGSFLQHRRNKAMAKAMDALHKSQVNGNNRLNRYRDDMLMYGQFSLNGTEEITNSLRDMYEHQSNIEDYMRNLTTEWPRWYLSDPAGISYYTSHLSVYIQTLNEKYNIMYRELLDNLHRIITGVAKLSQGHLAPEIIPHSLLQSSLDDIAMQIRETHPEYTLALTHISQYYDMKLVTFGIDKDRSLIVTFPVFLKRVHHVPLILHEIENVPVPIFDLNSNTSSYTKIVINKPYIATAPQHYIQLKMEELRMCKSIQYEYFCEELFTVKHSSKDTCESALFYDKEPSTISNSCETKVYLHKSVTPSVLDGGSEIVLANMDPYKTLKCHKHMDNMIPPGEYVKTNRSILCNCSIEAGLSYLLPDIGACTDASNKPTFQYTANLAFLNTYREMNKILKKPLPPTFNNTITTNNRPMPPFPISLNKSLIPSGITTLNQMITNLKKAQIDGHLVDIAMDTSDSTDADITTFLSADKLADLFSNKIVTVISSICMVVYTLWMVWLTIQHHKTRSLLKTAIMATSLSFPMSDAQTTTEYTKVVCQNSWLSALVTCFSIGAVLFYIAKFIRSQTLCKGYRFKQAFTIYMFISDNIRYIPVKIIHLSGQLHKLHLSEPLYPDQVQMTKKLIWDILHIHWRDSSISYEGDTLHLPSDVVIPLLDKVRLRRLLSTGDYKVHAMVKQGNTWYNLHNSTMTRDPSILPSTLLDIEE